MKRVNTLVVSKLGERIAAARERAGYTQDRLAALLGTTQPTVYRWENGENPPKLPQFLTLCQVLDAGPLFLLTGEGSETFSPTEAEEKLQQIRELVAPTPAIPAESETPEETEEEKAARLRRLDEVAHGEAQPEGRGGPKKRAEGGGGGE